MLPGSPRSRAGPAQPLHMFTWKPFNNIIFGINESVRGKQVVGFLLS